MVVKTQLTNGTVYIPTGTKNIKVVSGVNATVQVVAPINYTIQGVGGSGTISAGRSVTLELGFNSTYKVSDGYFDGTVGGGDVTSVFARTGAVTAQANDYQTGLVPESAGNLYFTAARVLATVLSGLNTGVSQVIVPSDTILQALGYLQAQITSIGVAVTSISIATANGFSGNSSGGSTPILTLSTTITGILKGSAGAITAAIANTDYQAPILFTTMGTNGAATFSGASLNIPVYQAAGTYVTSLTVTPNQGVSGSFTAGATPALTITLGALTGVTSFNGLVITANTGVVTTGSWNGSAIISTYGGTGLTSYTQGDLLYYDTGTALSKLAKSTSATRYLSNQGTNNNPSWNQIDLTNGVTGVLPAANGGSDAWVDISGTATVVGWSSTTVKVIRYKIGYKEVLLDINIVGTSDNSTTTVVIPSAIQLGTSAANLNVPIYTINSGTTATGLMAINIANRTLCVFAASVAGASFNNTGTKAVVVNTKFEID